jgi:superfamily I DNA/RNA helicase
MMNLNASQKKAIFNTTGNVLIKASPGTGKTRTLVARASHKIDSLPRHKSIALITYTNTGADEISSRLEINKNLFTGTIHSFCLEYILRPFSWIYKWERPKVISYELQELFFSENDDIKLDENFGQNKFEELNKIAHKIDGSLNLEVDWDHSKTLQEVAQRYYLFQETHGVIDFNEILYRSLKLVSEQKFIAESLSAKFYEILVDEFQDTNLFQYNILKEIMHNGECSFFMVGDNKQRIFSFAGAIEDSFGNAIIDFNASEETLTETYRSTDKIVEVYKKLFLNHSVIENKSSISDLNIDIIFHETKKSNHESIIKLFVDELIKKHNVAPEEVAILSTSWYTAFPVSQILRKDYNVVGLGALPHKYINNSTSTLLKSLSRYYIKPNIRNLSSIKRNIDIYLLDNDIIYPDKILVLKTNKLVTKFVELNMNENLNNGLFKIERIFKNFSGISDSLFGIIRELITDDEKRYWSLSKYIQAISGVNGIFSDTIHKSKGLEFDAVILNGVNENKIPYQKVLDRSSWTYEGLTTEGIENGRNLLYVGLSRAKKYLIILHNWKPSIFIEVIK